VSRSASYCEVSMKKIDYVVPEGVVAVEYILCGGDGGAAADGTPGAQGETVWMYKRVKPGQVLTFHLGEGGSGCGGGQPGQDAMFLVWPIEEST